MAAYTVATNPSVTLCFPSLRTIPRQSVLVSTQRWYHFTGALLRFISVNTVAMVLYHFWFCITSCTILAQRSYGTSDLRRPWSNGWGRGGWTSLLGSSHSWSISPLDNSLMAATPFPLINDVCVFFVNKKINCGPFQYEPFLAIPTWNLTLEV